MSNDFENLKKDIQALYPGESFTDTELNQMANRIIKAFAISAKALQKTKKQDAILDLHNQRKSEQTVVDNIVLTKDKQY